MEPHNSNRKYSVEEKRQLIANLDIEVAHRLRQFEAWLTDRLENFTIHQEGQVSRIPKQVRGMTMREFGEKYQGNVQAALRGFQKEKLAAAGGDTSLADIDKNMRKRKWIASQELEGEPLGSESKDESLPLMKNARIIPLSPKKVPSSSKSHGAMQRARSQASAVPKATGVPKTIGRTPASPSTTKAKATFTTNYDSLPPSRPTSPTKPSPSKPVNGHHRVPSSSTFNPLLHPQTPAYSTDQQGNERTALRLPRRDESMLSINGSPLANPYELGVGWFRGVDMGEVDIDKDESEGNERPSRTLKRSKSSIVIRRDPSVAFPSTLNGLHSRTESQSSFYTASSLRSSSHSRENSQSTHNTLSQLSAFRFPSSHPQPPDGHNLEATPKPRHHTRSFSAMVTIPTRDGHLLEFDPLQTSPGALDSLEGITDSAKKQARIEMGMLVQAAVDKWRIV